MKEQKALEVKSLDISISCLVLALFAGVLSLFWHFWFVWVSGALLIPYVGFMAYYRHLRSKNREQHEHRKSAPAHEIESDVRLWKKGDLLVRSSDGCWGTPKQNASVCKSNDKTYYSFLGFADPYTIIYRQEDYNWSGHRINTGQLEETPFHLFWGGAIKNVSYELRRHEEEQTRIKEKLEETSDYQQFLDSYREEYQQLTD